MNTKDKNLLARRGLLAGMAAASVAPALGQSRPRPNILYINSHDTGRYIQPYGHAVPTPHLQRLSEAGILFRQAFSAAPTCSPSRAALLTGQAPHSAGCLGLANRGFYPADYKQHILHTLRTAGYTSVLVGHQHIAPLTKPEIIGYDVVAPCKDGFAVNVAPAAVEFLNRKPKQPFWLEIGFFETHRVFHKPGPAEDARYCLPPSPNPDTRETREDFAGFKASARVLDQAVGEILKALEANGLAENTIVIYTTDHGIAFPAMKCNLNDHGLGISLIIRGPEGFSGGKVCDAMVSQIDLFPTVCDLLEIERPAWLQGKSIMPLVRGNAPEVNDEIFGEVNFHAAYEPMRAVRTRRWKYVRQFGGRNRPVLVNCDESPSKHVWLDHGWRNRAVAAEELYDLMFDPCERHNMAPEPSAAKALEEMRGRVDRWMRSSRDPLLKGPVQAPSGSAYNQPDAIMAREPVHEVP